MKKTILFVMPSCDKCIDIKRYFDEKNIPYKLYNIATIEGMDEFKRIYNKIKEQIKHNPDGSVCIPVVLFFDDKENLINAANSLGEVKRITEHASLRELNQR